MKLTTQVLINAYCQGAFPMANNSQGEVEFYTCNPRAIVPLEGFHVPHGLRRRLRKNPFDIRRDSAFAHVIAACAEPRSYAPETWINPQIIEAYIGLHRQGLAHSVEAWVEDEEGQTGTPQPKLVGGLYGVALGGAFFGESMFSRQSDASKVCLAYLVEHLRQRGYVLLDTQFANEHMRQFGLVEIPLKEYLRRLKAALAMDISW